MPWGALCGGCLWNEGKVANWESLAKDGAATKWAVDPLDEEKSQNMDTPSETRKLILIGMEGLLTVAASVFDQQGYALLIFIPAEDDESVERGRLEALGHEIFEFERIDSDEAHQKAALFEPDYILSVVFEQRIPQSFCALARVCALNFHPASLPEFRTGNAWFWPLRMGARSSAITVHKLEHQWDSGNVVLSHPFDLGPYDTQGIYYERVCKEAAACFLALHERLREGATVGTPQPKSGYYPKLCLRDILVDWADSAESIDQLVRACNPHHFAETLFRDIVVQIIQVSRTQVDSSDFTFSDGSGVKPGFLLFDKTGLYCATHDTFLRVDIVGVYDKFVVTGSRFAEMVSVKSKEAFVHIGSVERYQNLLDRKL